MNWRRPGLAALLTWSVAGPAAADPEPAPLRAGASDRAPASETRGAGRYFRATQRPVSSGPVFQRGGSWTRFEASALVGSELVNQDLGYSTNIFQTVTARAEDVGFGEHFGARGAFFVSQYLGAEASYTRTTTEFEFSVTDDEGGVVVFEEPLLQESREVSLSLVVQVPLAAMTPYAVLGYGWRRSRVSSGDPFPASAPLFGAGIKVPFPRIPVALAFDYRRTAYPGGPGAFRLSEGATGEATVSALTMGVVFRLGALH